MELLNIINKINRYSIKEIYKNKSCIYTKTRKEFIDTINVLNSIKELYVPEMIIELKDRIDFNKDEIGLSIHLMNKDYKTSVDVDKSKYKYRLLYWPIDKTKGYAGTKNMLRIKDIILDRNE
jgi:hypothetical protein